jgi:hypothetical protein
MPPGGVSPAARHARPLDQTSVRRRPASGEDGYAPSHYGKEAHMRIGTSLVLIAIGAILTFAISVDAKGFNINTIGVILMIVGGVGLLVSLVLFSTADRRSVGYVREREVPVREREIPVRERDAY